MTDRTRRKEQHPGSLVTDLHTVVDCQVVGDGEGVVGVVEEVDGDSDGYSTDTGEGEVPAIFRVMNEMMKTMGR